MFAQSAIVMLTVAVLLSCSLYKTMRDMLVKTTIHRNPPRRPIMIALAALVLVVSAVILACSVIRSVRDNKPLKESPMFNQSLFVLLVTTLFFACNVARAIQTN